MRQTPIQRICSLLGSENQSDTLVSGYQIDSRLIQRGDLFFALAGQKTDGHAFLFNAAQNGAIGAVVHRSYRGNDFGLQLIFVDDVLAALVLVAKTLFEENPATIIGITGSVGKTTVKDFTAELLAGTYRVGKSPLSYNSQLTFPLNLLNRDGTEEVLVLEMGMSAPGELSKLIAIAPPDLAVVTMVGLSHAAAFPAGVEAIAKEKCAIFSHPKTKRGCFFHGLYEYEAAAQIGLEEKISFSLENKAADYFMGFSEGKYFVDERGVRAYLLDLPFSQPHILHNLLASVTIARMMRVDWDTIQRQVKQLTLPKRRFEERQIKGVLFVDDAYNASPESMRAALASLPPPCEGGKRIGVLGAMKELGDFCEAEHRGVGQFAQKHLDHLLVLGEEAAALFEGFSEGKKPCVHCSDITAAGVILQELMRPGDVVLVKGSRSMNMERIFEHLNLE